VNNTPGFAGEGFLCSAYPKHALCSQGKLSVVRQNNQKGSIDG